MKQKNTKNSKSTFLFCKTQNGGIFIPISAAELKEMPGEHIRPLLQTTAAMMMEDVISYYQYLRAGYMVELERLGHETRKRKDQERLVVAKIIARKRKEIEEFS